MEGLSLTPIDGKDVGALGEVSSEELENLDKEKTEFEITVIEENLGKMKPNMAAIAEYRKKVCTGFSWSSSKAILVCILSMSFHASFSTVG